MTKATRNKSVATFANLATYRTPQTCERNMSISESKSILERIGGENEVDGYHYEDDYKAFGVSRHAVSLNCLSRSGVQVGIAWSLYCDSEFNPSKGITIEFTHKIVVIEGWMLLRLYHFILANRVTFIAEADQATAMLLQNNQESVVTNLTIDDRIKTAK